MDKKLLSFDAQLKRLRKASGATSDTELAKILGISQGGVSSAKKRGKIPAEWVKQIALKFNSDANWLFFGEGEQPLASGQPPEQSNTAGPKTHPCPLCEEAKAELTEEKTERRELARELREITAENRQLWKENGELKAELAELRARADPQEDLTAEANRRSA